MLAKCYNGPTYMSHKVYAKIGFASVSPIRGVRAQAVTAQTDKVEQAKR